MTGLVALGLLVGLLVVTWRLARTDSHSTSESATAGLTRLPVRPAPAEQSWRDAA